MSMLRPAALAMLCVWVAACSPGGGDKSSATSAPKAASATPSEHYSKLAKPQKPADPARVTVEEFFWYGCPHCYHLDPEVTAWLVHKPADVDFTRVPNSLGRPEGLMHARAFYIAQALGVGDKLHRPLFEAIQTDHDPLASLEAVRALFAKTADVTPKDFDGVATSFIVDSNVQRAEDLAGVYGITSVPSFVVGGEYLVANQTDVFKVIDAAIDKVRQERKR